MLVFVRFCVYEPQMRVAFININLSRCNILISANLNEKPAEVKNEKLTAFVAESVNTPDFFSILTKQL